MKKTILFFAVIAALANGLNAQTLQTERRTLVVNHSEDWCGACGDWGWDIHDSLVRRQTLNPNFKAYTVALHVSSNWYELNAPGLNALFSNVMPAPIATVPSFCVDNLDLDTFNDMDFLGDQDNIEDTLIRPAIDSLLYYIDKETSQPANVGVGFNAQVKGTDSLIVKTRVKALTNLTGEYRIAVYVAQDSMYGFQQDLDAVTGWHRYTLKDAVQYGVWGKALFTGSAAANAEYFTEFKMKIPATWKIKDLSYYAIVYKKNTATSFYEIENATNKSTELTSTGVSSILTQPLVELYPVPAKNKLYLRTEHFGENNCEVELISITGQLLGKLYTGKLSTQVSFNLPQVPSGNYLLRIKSEEGFFVKKLQIEQ